MENLGRKGDFAVSIECCLHGKEIPANKRFDKSVDQNEYFP
jgi:hypothetical protein